MEHTFLDEEFVKSNKTVSCPCCDKRFKIDLNNTDILCNGCGEHFQIELNKFSEDFVWCPDQKY